MHAPTTLLALTVAHGVAILAQSVPFSQAAFSQLDGSRAGPEFDETPVGKLSSISLQCPCTVPLTIYLVHLLFPPSRGASSLVSGVVPCQGYELGNRISYPITGGTISWAGIVSVYGMEFRYSTSEDPSSQDDFDPALTNVTKSLRGQTCVQGPDFDDLGLEIGQNVTLQLYYEAGPTRRPNVECADFTLVSEEDFADANYETSCVNHIASTQDVRDSSSNPNIVALRDERLSEVRAQRADLEAQYRVGSGLTNVESGVIGAMVTLGVLLIVFIVALVAGGISFGRSRKRRAESVGSHDSLEKPSARH